MIFIIEPDLLIIRMTQPFFIKKIELQKSPSTIKFYFCSFIAACSHSRAYEYFAESIGDNRFDSVQCESTAQLSLGTCSGPHALMGDHINHTARGIYYLKTNSKFPFAKGLMSSY